MGNVNFSIHRLRQYDRRPKSVKTVIDNTKTKNESPPIPSKSEHAIARARTRHSSCCDSGLTYKPYYFDCNHVTLFTKRPLPIQSGSRLSRDNHCSDLTSDYKCKPYSYYFNCNPLPTLTKRRKHYEVDCIDKTDQCCPEPTPVECHDHEKHPNGDNAGNHPKAKVTKKAGSPVRNHPKAQVTKKTGKVVGKPSKAQVHKKSGGDGGSPPPAQVNRKSESDKGNPPKGQVHKKSGTDGGDPPETKVTKEKGTDGGKVPLLTPVRPAIAKTSISPPLKTEASTTPCPDPIPAQTKSCVAPAAPVQNKPPEIPQATAPECTASKSSLSPVVPKKLTATDIARQIRSELSTQPIYSAAPSCSATTTSCPAKVDACAQRSKSTTCTTSKSTQ